MINKKKYGKVFTATLSSKEISDILTRHILNKSLCFSGNFNTEMRTTATPDIVFIELKIEELEEESV